MLNAIMRVRCADQKSCPALSLSSLSLCEQNISARADAIHAHCSQPVARSFVFGKRQSASVVPNQQGADF
jgi:hypothetical protein